MEFPAGTVTNFHVIVCFPESPLILYLLTILSRMILPTYTAGSTARNH